MKHIHRTLLAAFSLVVLLHTTSSSWAFEEGDLVVRPDQKSEIDGIPVRMTPVVCAKYEWIESLLAQKTVVDANSLKLLANEEIKRKCELLAKDLTEGKVPSSMFFSHSPVILGSSLASDVKLDADVFSMLTIQLRDQLDQAVKSRQSRLHEAFVLQILNMIDEQFYLTSQQHRSLKVHLYRAPEQFHHALYSYDRNAKYYGMIPAGAQLTLPSQFFSNSQEELLKELTSEEKDWHFKITVPEGRPIETWGETILSQISGRQDVLLRYMQLRCDFLSTSENMTPTRRHRLQMACTGIMQRMSHQHLVEEWARVSFYHREYGITEWHVSYPHPHEIQENPFWKYVLACWENDPIVRERALRFQKARLAYLSALLDQELWFKPDQVEPMNILLKRKLDSLTTPQEMHVYGPLVYDLQLIARVVIVTPDEEVSSILSETQMAAWKSLKSQFDVFDQTIYVESRHDRFGIATIP